METLLIANRGEIAVRIARTARAEGYRTAAIYSDADRDALHVRACDTAIAIGGNTAADSYLRIDKILAAASRAGATAIHPGYGFLAENADFARACADKNLRFVGPSADTIELMGNKRRAKDFVEAAGVPCIPGYRGGQDDDTLVARAREIGLPLMIKAAAGGGGRGMRLVKDDSELAAQLRSARSEARSAFGSDELILEKALLGARHIEIQVFADSRGNTIHLGERDCSIQRRHQKILEESPSPAVDPPLRERMGAAAVAAARACRYLGAGTVEFLLDRNGDFYFLEMNTRLQVEHPVTEMVTGFDLVAWQLAVARGELLPVTQDRVPQRGHAIEARLYAEDPLNGFLPQSGRILYWREPAATGIRLDHGIREHTKISPYYDPMLGKLIACGDSRGQALRRLRAALTQLQLIGPKNNIPFLLAVLDDAGFAAGESDTGFLDTFHYGEQADNPEPEIFAIAAVLNHHRRLSPRDRHSGRANWCSGDNSLPLAYRLQAESGQRTCALRCSGTDRYRVLVDEREAFEVRVHSMEETTASLSVDEVRQQCTWLHRDNRLHLLRAGRQWQLADITCSPASATQGPGSGRITAPMDGCIVEMMAELQHPVRRGDTLAVMEAMKMEHPLKADRDGTVTAVSAAPGEQVRGGQLLIEIAEK
ncbi:acetyl/propionyl/methylcrotonyl-CoA carboxylase subunit alpha [Microbulbifer litoralis]|uniref:acetyl/propionyl/methylcrotonyl-CoA carboxylase subunit alpha n=1 Tax=Microbulbifer litoralis TaxID=2933965 RepID=UPI0020277771|nr:biotin carboxylase N-terminal domain-containing protein [Microbulbifer sp. GX H0434]